MFGGPLGPGGPRWARSVQSPPDISGAHWGRAPVLEDFRTFLGPESCNTFRSTYKTFRGSEEAQTISAGDILYSYKFHRFTIIMLIVTIFKAIIKKYLLK